MQDQGSEFGLGAFEVAIMLLTHPERLLHEDDLWIDCAGGEFAPETNGAFSDAPIFDFSDGRLGFGTGPASLANANYGSASGFSPQ